MTDKTISTRKTIRGLKIFIALTLLGLLFLLFRSSIPESYELLKHFKFKYILFAIALNGTDWFVGGLRIWILSGAVHKELKFSSSFKASMSNIFMAGVTPSQTGGGPAQIYVLYKDGMSLAKATISSMMCFISSVLVLTLSALYLNFIYRVEINNTTFTFLSRTTISIFISIFFLFLLSLIRPSAFENGIRRLLNFLSPIKRFLERRGWLESFLKGVREYHDIVGFYLKEGKRAFFIGILLTAIIYLNKFSIAYVVVHGMGFDPPYVKVLYIQMLLLLIFYFAPSPGASGVAEMSAATLMGVLIPKSSHAIFVILWRTFTLYLGMAIGGSIFMKYLLKSENSN
jgi:uncharacterized protein (TIRG00374 family)